MREIKFRVWNVVEKRWGRSSQVEYGGENMMGWICDPTGYLEIMLYAGLQDKNGKEIYEGDIINTVKNYIGQVIWWNACWCIRVYKSTLRLGRSDQIPCEVIGNIWENPDLLKEN